MRFKSFFKHHKASAAHNGWKILGHVGLALSAKCETVKLDQYIWRNLVAWFPTRRLFDAGHLKLVGLRQFVFLLHLDFHEPWPKELVFLVFVLAWNWPFLRRQWTMLSAILCSCLLYTSHKVTLGLMKVCNSKISLEWILNNNIQFFHL